MGNLVHAVVSSDLKLHASIQYDWKAYLFLRKVNPHQCLIFQEVSPGCI